MDSLFLKMPSASKYLNNHYIKLQSNRDRISGNFNFVNLFINKKNLQKYSHVKKSRRVSLNRSSIATTGNIIRCLNFPQYFLISRFVIKSISFREDVDIF